MTKKSIGAIVLLWLPLSALAGDVPLDPLDQWPQWRGPLQTGVAPPSGSTPRDAPTKFSKEPTGSSNRSQ